MHSQLSARRPSPNAYRAMRFAAVTTLAVALTFLLSLSPTVSALSYDPGDPVSWTNGLVLCQFASGSPSVGVSALSLQGTGLTVSVWNVSEVRPDQSIAAVTNLTGLTWKVTNLSTDDAFDLGYSVHAPLSRGPASSAVVGSADLTVEFVLPAYQGSSAGSTDAVKIVISVANWTWQASGDHLALAFGASPSFPTTEHLNTTSAPGWLLASTSNASGSVLERVGASTFANATTAAGPNATVDANASLAISSPALASVTVAFGASAGAFTSLSFTARVGIVLPATIAGVPTGDLVAAGIAAVLVSLLVAVTARRIRQKPSKLIFVPQEGKP